MMTPKQAEIDILKVEIRKPATYSFHSISGSPTIDDIDDNHHSQRGRRAMDSSLHTTVSLTPDVTSYTLSPNDILSSGSICTSSFDDGDNNAFPDTKKIESVEPQKKTSPDTLLSHGYIRCKYITDTLQGQIFFALHRDFGQVVIKKTRKDLYANGITISKEGDIINIQEDVVSEAEIMRKFMLNSPPASLIKFYEFFEDSDAYYLVTENGGRDLFDFVVDCHELISSGKLCIKEWRKQCKFMFAQMVECIDWLHNEMKYCHLDISLENILISNEVQFDEESGTLSKCYIKFIDFGLAEAFNLHKNPSYLCKKFVGKTHYKSPQVYAKKEAFCANKADVWSLGICLFMMIVGAPLYDEPCNKDVKYRFIKNKKIAKLLYAWNRIKYVTPNLYDLIERMLCCEEEERITMDGIIRHKWCKIHSYRDINTNVTQHAASINECKYITD